MKKIFEKLFGTKKNETFYWKKYKRDNGLILLQCYYTVSIRGVSREKMEPFVARPNEVKRLKKGFEANIKNVVVGGAWSLKEDECWRLAGGCKMRAVKREEGVDISFSELMSKLPFCV